MRIDKMVRAILRKQWEPVVRAELTDRAYNAMWPPETIDESDVIAWAQPIVDELMAAPDLDVIAAEFGTSIEAVLSHRISPMEITFKLYGPKELPMVGGSAGWGDITIRVPWETYETNSTGEVIEILVHEFAHMMDTAAGTNAPGAARGFEEWINSPDEQEAMKATIMEMMNTGYTDEQILGLFYDHYDSLLDEQPQEDVETFTRIIEELIADVNSHYEPLVER